MQHNAPHTMQRTATHKSYIMHACCYTRTRAPVRVHMRMHTQMHGHTSARAHTHTQRARAQTHICAHSHVHMLPSTRAHACAHLCLLTLCHGCLLAGRSHAPIAAGQTKATQHDTKKLASHGCECVRVCCGAYTRERTPLWPLLLQVIEQLPQGPV